MKTVGITLAIALVVIFFVPVQGISFGFSSGTGGHSSSVNIYGSVDNDASVNGKIAIDEGHLEPSLRVTEHRNPNPGILPPNSKLGGKTYGQWNAQWWKWALSLPVDENNPLFMIQRL